MEKSKKKNAFIELLRFLFCILIFLHHSDGLLDEGMTSAFPNGAIAVEFFFMLSGYLSAVHLSRRVDPIEGKMCYSMKYSLDKVLRLFPYAAFGTLCSYGYYLCVGNSENPWYTKLPALKNLPAELSFTILTGVSPLNLISCKSAHLWFVSALLIALPLVMYLALRFNDLFKGWLVWFLPPMLYAYLGLRNSTVFDFGTPVGLVYDGLIRAFAGMMLGFAAFYAVTWLNGKEIKNVFVKIIATLFIVAALVYTAVFSKEEHTFYDQIFAIYLLFFMIILVFSNLSYTRAFDNLKISTVFGYLGKLAMPMYCIHWAVIGCSAKLTYIASYTTCVLVDIAITILLSAGLMALIDAFKKRKKRAVTQ